MPKPSNDTAKFILQRLYFLRLYKIPRSKWKRKIGDEWIDGKHGTSDEFIPAWEFLEKKGLV